VGRHAANRRGRVRGRVVSAVRPRSGRCRRQ
jgi:hypothetical protein